MFVFYVSESVSVLYISSFESFILDSIYVQYHNDIFLFLSYLLSMIISSIHVTANGIIAFFLWLSNIPLHIGITSSLSIPLLMGI